MAQPGPVPHVVLLAMHIGGGTALFYSCLSGHRPQRRRVICITKQGMPRNKAIVGRSYKYILQDLHCVYVIMV